MPANSWIQFSFIYMESNDNNSCLKVKGPRIAPGLARWCSNGRSNKGIIYLFIYFYKIWMFWKHDNIFTQSPSRTAWTCSEYNFTEHKCRMRHFAFSCNLLTTKLWLPCCWWCKSGSGHHTSHQLCTSQSVHRLSIIKPSRWCKNRNG